MRNYLVRIPACDRRTDRRTDILPQHSPRYAYASRSKIAKYPTCIQGPHRGWPHRNFAKLF